LQFDHEQPEIAPKALSLVHDLAIEVEARHVLGGGGRDQPPVVSGNKSTLLHGFRLVLALGCCDAFAWQVSYSWAILRKANANG
jgi:hypothetical protein